MDMQSILAIIFLFLLTFILYLKRKNLHIQKILYPIIYFAMYKTKLGINFMDKFASRFSKPLKYIGYSAIFLGFLGMIVIAFSLIQNLYRLIITPTAVAGVGLVLPFKVKGAFFVPFFYWIISIFILAVVHEASHGIIARVYNIKIKSSGFAFLGILIPVLPAAFVETDEEELKKRPKKQQLSVFAAGPFSNILLGVLCLLFFIFVLMPFVSSWYEYKGVNIIDVEQGYPAYSAGIKRGEIILQVNNMSIKTVNNLTVALQNKKPGEIIKLTTNKTTYNLRLTNNPSNESAAYMGVSLSQNQEIKDVVYSKYGRIIPAIVVWFIGLIFWLYLLNIGIGLFNLVPLGPIDGGRMLKTVAEHLFEKDKGDKVWKYISLFFLLLIIINLGFGFVR
jgi:membrane-associated protease RseP (regulator of RpoE activity)